MTTVHHDLTNILDLTEVFRTLVPGSLIDRRKKVAMVKGLLRREMEDRIDQGLFLCIAMHQGAIMVGYKTGCRQWHLEMAEEAGFRPLSLGISRKSIHSPS